MYIQGTGASKLPDYTSIRTSNPNTWDMEEFTLTGDNTVGYTYSHPDGRSIYLPRDMYNRSVDTVKNCLNTIVRPDLYKTYYIGLGLAPNNYMILRGISGILLSINVVYWNGSSTAYQARNIDFIADNTVSVNAVAQSPGWTYKISDGLQIRNELKIVFNDCYSYIHDGSYAYFIPCYISFTFQE